MQFYKQFSVYAATLPRSQKIKVACRTAAKRLLYNALSLCKSNAGMLLKYVKNVISQNITEREDFGTPYHTAASEPFFYDTAYKSLYTNSILEVDRFNKCLVYSEKKR